MPIPKQPRTIGQIALDVSREWAKPYYGAVPYLSAMLTLDHLAVPFVDADQKTQWRRTMYGCDTAESVVLYFLSNASTFKGERAKALKAELKEHLASLKKLNAK